MENTNTLPGATMHKILLGVVAVALIAVVAFLFLRTEQVTTGETVLIPTLDLEIANKPVGLVARLIGSDTQEEIHYFSTEEAAVGFTALAGDKTSDTTIERHNLFDSSSSGLPVNVAFGDPAAFGVNRYWGYEYTGNEAQNEANGLEGPALFDGRFWLSDGELAVTGDQYSYLNTADVLVAGKRYYLMTETDITVSSLDSDGDQINDGREGDLGTDKDNADSDGDGVNDGAEVVAGTNPTMPPICGDGTVEAAEECDDGNDISGDGCSGPDHPNGGCFVEFCGDGFLDLDGIPGNDGNMYWAEECDDGSVCIGEGGFSAGGLSVDRLALPKCTTFGTGIGCGPGEECTTVSFDGCSMNCKIERCGDGDLQVQGVDLILGTPDDEECDDGNDINNDGCLDSCERASCGDGIVWDGNEDCDDGDTVAGDGCSVTCTVEDGWKCTDTTCTPIFPDITEQ